MKRGDEMEAGPGGGGAAGSPGPLFAMGGAGGQAGQTVGAAVAVPEPGAGVDLSPLQKAAVLPQDASLRERFEAFHAANPQVYKAIASIARELKARGWQKVGISFIYERLRWLGSLRTKGEEYRLPNNHRAFYARKIMEHEADLAGFFTVSLQRSAAYIEDGE